VTTKRKEEEKEEISSKKDPKLNYAGTRFKGGKIEE